MNLQVCELCATPFKWKKIVSSISRSYRPLCCSECGTEHKITVASRLIVAFLTVIPMQIIAYSLYELFSSVFISVAIAVLYAVLALLLFPFLVKYHS